MRSLCLLALLAGVSGNDGVSDWFSRASALQRYAAYDVRINDITWIATHNSYSWDGEAATHSPFEVATNQIYGVTTQLQCFGVRGLELDPRWVEDIDKLKVCHVGDTEANAQYTACQTASWTLCNACGVFNYGAEDTGCSADAPDMAKSLEEIAQWLEAKRNHQEVLFVKLDSHLGDQAAKASTAISSVFGTKMVYGPSDFDTQYPTPAEMLAAGKRIAFFGSEPSDLVFQLSEDIKSPEELRAKPCGGSIAQGAEFGRAQGGANDINVVVGGVSLFKEAADPRNFLGASQVVPAMACGLSVSLDRLNGSLAEATIWSWAEGHPNVDDDAASDGGDLCAYISIADGRWRERGCDSKSADFLHACRKDDDYNTWVLTKALKAFDADPQCPLGYAFGAPRTATENAALVAALGAADDAAAWIYYRSGAGGRSCWQHEGGTEYCAPDAAPTGCDDLTPPAVDEGSYADTCATVTGAASRDPLYQPPPYTPNGVVEDLFGWPRVAGSSYWQDDEAYARDVVMSAVPFLAVGALLAVLLLPASYYFLGKRIKQAAPHPQQPQQQRQAGGRRWTIAFAVAALLAAAGAAMAIGGLAVFSRQAESSLNEASEMGDELEKSDMEAAELKALLVSGTGLAAAASGCPDVAEVMVRLEAAMLAARKSLNEFLETGLGSIGRDINKAVDTANGDPKASIGVFIGFAVLALLAAVGYSLLLFVAHRAQASAAKAAGPASTAAVADSQATQPGGKVPPSGPSGSGRRGGGAGAAEQRARQAERIGCLALPVALLAVFLSWAAWGLATAGGLYSADFCIAPADNLIASVDKGRVGTVDYYLTCEGTLPALAKCDLAYAGALIGQGLVNDAVTNSTIKANCPVQYPTLLRLQTTMDTAVRVAGGLGDTISCSNINPFWASGVETDACHGATRGLAVVMAGFAIVAFTLAAALLTFRPAVAHAVAAAAAAAVGSVKPGDDVPLKPGDALVLGDDDTVISPMAPGGLAIRVPSLHRLAVVKPPDSPKIA